MYVFYYRNIKVRITCRNILTCESIEDISRYDPRIFDLELYHCSWTSLPILIYKQIVMLTKCCQQQATNRFQLNNRPSKMAMHLYHTVSALWLYPMPLDKASPQLYRIFLKNNIQIMNLILIK